MNDRTQHIDSFEELFRQSLNNNTQAPLPDAFQRISARWQQEIPVSSTPQNVVSRIISRIGKAIGKAGTFAKVSLLVNVGLGTYVVSDIVTAHHDKGQNPNKPQVENTATPSSDSTSVTNPLVIPVDSAKTMVGVERTKFLGNRAVTGNSDKEILTPDNTPKEETNQPNDKVTESLATDSVQKPTEKKNRNSGDKITEYLKKQQASKKDTGVRLFK